MAPTDTRSPLPGLLTPARTPGPAAPARTQEQTPARIPRRNPPGPGPSGKCFDCGGSHHRRDCPTKRDFCVRYGFLFSTLSVLLTFRCLSKTGEHKHWQCPALQDCCHICSGNGLGEAAYGHTRYTPLLDFFLPGRKCQYIQQQIILLLCLLYILNLIILGLFTMRRIGLSAIRFVRFCPRLVSQLGLIRGSMKTKGLILWSKIPAHFYVFPKLINYSYMLPCIFCFGYISTL